MKRDYEVRPSEEPNGFYRVWPEGHRPRWAHVNLFDAKNAIPFQLTEATLPRLPKRGMPLTGVYDSRLGHTLNVGSAFYAKDIDATFIVVPDGSTRHGVRWTVIDGDAFGDLARAVEASAAGVAPGHGVDTTSQYRWT